MRRSSVVAVAVVALAACQDQTPTGPRVSPQASISALSVDGFYWISPLPPGSPVGTGTFDERLLPILEVNICRWDGAIETGACLGEPNAHEVTFAAPALTVDEGKEQYQVDWMGLNQLKADAPNDRYYRIEVRYQNGVVLGSTLVYLSNGGSDVGAGAVNVAGNTLPIKFRVEVQATCPDDPDCDLVIVSPNGGNFLGEPEDEDTGKFGFQFDPDWCDDQGGTFDCTADVALITSRYRGPERCIPSDALGYDAIQYEVCVRARTIPDGVKFNPNKVYVGVCVDPRAAAFESNGLLRLLKINEDGDGNAIGAPVDLNATSSAFFFDCPGVFQTAAAGTSNRFLPRLATWTGQVLARAARFVGPKPAYASRRGNGPYVASLDDLSRIGPVLRTAALFDQDFGFGLPNQLLPESERPRVRVVALQPNGALSVPLLGVPAVQVRFTAQTGSVNPTISVTNAEGYVSAQWTLGTIAQNPQRLKAEVGAPSIFPPVTGVDGVSGEFPNGEGTAAYWWAEKNFTAIAAAYFTTFLSPLGEGTKGLTNAPGITPTVRVCGPVDVADPFDLTTCTAVNKDPGAPKVKQNSWETSWATKNETENELYRIDVLVGTQVVGSFLLRLGGGGGSDPAGTHQAQVSSNVVIRFIVSSVAP